MDLAEASGAFGLLSGLLSALLPYFLGLTLALSIVGAGVGLLRLFGPGAEAASGPRHALALLAPVAVGWTVFVADPAPVARWRGLLLGLSSIPLWWTVRRRRPFGGLG
jgi:hypothetical protein